MASGHGVNGGRGRCHFLWRDFMACVERNGKVSMGVCQEEREDYVECLHHYKLARRLDRIQEEKDKLIKAGKWPPKEATSP